MPIILQSHRTDNHSITNLSLSLINSPTAPLLRPKASTPVCRPYLHPPCSEAPRLTALRDTMQNSAEFAGTRSRQTPPQPFRIRVLCGLDTLIYVIFITIFTCYYGADLTAEAVESCSFYHQGQQSPRQCTADLLRLVASYILVIPAAYLFYICCMARLQEYNTNV